MSWLDAPAALAPPKLVVDRVVPVAAGADSDLTITSVVLYLDVIEVSWYAAPSAEVKPDVAGPAALGGPFGLALADDRDTSYSASGGSWSDPSGRVFAGRTTFRPAPPAGAAWIDVVRRGNRRVRVPL